MSRAVLVINPGSTSTKVAYVREGGEVVERTLRHRAEEIAGRSLADQEALREAAVRAFLAEHALPFPDAVCGRGGPMRPVEGGTYAVDDAMLEDLRSARFGEHASLLGGVLADRLAREMGVPAFVVDPVSVDELDDVARVSGVPEIARRARSHALSLKAVARRAAAALHRPLVETRLVGVHLGGGISVAALRGGRIVDVNDALLGMGPFSPFRAGALPLQGLLGLAFAPGATREALERRLATEAGLYAYLGTGDLPQVEARIDAGDAEAARVHEAMIYQIAKEVGAMAAALAFRVDGLAVTGGMAQSERLVARLRAYVGDLAPILLYPGEREMEALAEGALRVLRGDEPARRYGAGEGP